jgi:hypothetical protein
MMSSKKELGSARFSVSYELLVDMLNLPSDTEIEAIYPGRVKTTFDVYVHHPDLPKVLPGDKWPESCPVMKSQEPIIFVDWGVYDEIVE